MKTTNVIRIGLVALSFSAMVACKKDNASSNTTPATVDLQTSTDDQTMASNENDLVSSDVSASLESNGSYSRIFADPNASNASMRVDGNSPVCDATLAYDTTGATKTLTITYNGTNCFGNRTRTGIVVISEAKGVHWKDAGAVVTIAIQNLTITRVRDGKSIVVNGVKKLTNISGGLLLNLATHGPITHEISDTLSVTFDKGAVRTWNVSKHRVFTYDNGVKLTTTGTHSDGTNIDIAEWGTNRFGVSFSSRISVAKIITQACDFRLISGQNIFTRGDKFSAVVTYGLDAGGNPVTSCPSGNFYAKVDWTYIPTGKTGSFLFQY
ncbi:MAG: hypothetical protein ABJB86_21330 [Bacteroidota bacterium]